MADQSRSLEDAINELLPDAELAELGLRIGSQRPASDFRLAVRNSVAVAVAVSISNPRPWTEQKQGLAKVSVKAANCKRRRENPSVKRPGCPVAPE